MAVRIILRGTDGDLAVTLKTAFDKKANKVVDAVKGTMDDVRDEIKLRGDEDISSAGEFGSRWNDSLHVEGTQDGLRAVVKVWHTIPYWHIFQNGGTIQGKPLLWLPLPWVPKGTKAKDLSGRLFFVDRSKRGLPPLLGNIDSKEMLFVGLPQVTLRKRFHLTEICTDVASKIGKLFKARLMEE